LRLGLLSGFFLGINKYPDAMTMMIEADIPTIVAVGKGAILK
jgi:hypothetical protein